MLQKGIGIMTKQNYNLESRMINKGNRETPRNGRINDPTHSKNTFR